MPIDRYREWKLRNNAVGCVFARYMALNPARFGQRAEMVSGVVPAAVAADIAARIDALIADPTATAAALILPDVVDLPTVVAIAFALDALPSWCVTRTVLNDTPIGDVVAFNVVRDIPFEGSTCPSEALVLGPYDEFPNTRRAPVTALEIYVGAPPQFDAVGEPTTKGHLALVDIEPASQAVYDRMFRNTRRERLRSLNGIDDTRAKAKVAFSVPMAIAQTIVGCVP